MKTDLKRRCGGALLVAAGLAAGWLLRPPPGGAEPAAPTPLASGIVRWADAKPTVAKWGELRRYFAGETYGTTEMFTAVVVLKPGEAVHPAHRHAEEEYMAIQEGSGRWHLDGKESPAEKGDVLYAAPWVMHGLVNTGDAPLTFFVVKWNGKGVPAPPKPPGEDGR